MPSNGPIKFFIIAGEPSGDLHGAKLIQAIKSINNNTSFMGHGGDLMQNEGMKIIEHTNNLSIMGFKEVIMHLPRMLKIMKKTIKIIESVKPDKIILIDYPGFNLRLAKNINHLNVPIFYFILPQAWAWKSKRVKLMKKTLSQSFSIFPFEKKWYQSKGLSVKYYGHPFVETEHLNENTKQFFKRQNLNPKKPILTLLPGSRQQEIDRHWHIFLKTVELVKKLQPNVQIILAKSNNVHIQNIPKYYCIESNSKKAILVASVALVASGTATLECGIERVPIVVCYKLSFFSWIIAKYIIRIKYISIVNLIAEKKIVPEYIQSEMKPIKMRDKLIELLDPMSKSRLLMLKNLEQMKIKLGAPGVYKNVAESIIKEGS
tara:strand:+ start:910 stop:2034 length:1125 start_codon:yes stop_codon:yes gene_type:complete